MPHGDYQKIKEIGSGSFGHAYLVQTNPSAKGGEKKLLVMKEIDLSNQNAQQRAAAEVEVKVLSALKHPYIVRYWESFMKNSQLCIIMDYCEGGDMWQYIVAQKKKHTTIPEAQVLRWLTQMCLAMKFMHEKNILHRDIKSQNVFLTRKEGSDLRCAKIADFGIAKVLKDSQSMAQTLVGTPYYLSPEICQKQPYACPSDIWAVGCVLFEMCALRVPFDAQDINQLVERIVRGTLPRIPSMYSKELSDIGAELLTREASRRPTASTILQRPMVQAEIKRMLSANRKDTIVLEAPCSARAPSNDSIAEGRMRPLGEHNPRERVPSAKQIVPLSARSPSPHKGAAFEVLKPSRAASPAPPTAR
jgi:NIMA (never in mitosis gene a)-related kinase 1/4/5